MEIIYLSLLCHHHNDSCIMTGSDESHVNVSLTVRDKVTRQCPRTTIFEEKVELKRIRTEGPLLTARPNRFTESSRWVGSPLILSVATAVEWGGNWLSHRVEGQCNRLGVTPHCRLITRTDVRGQCKRLGVTQR